MVLTKTLLEVLTTVVEGDAAAMVVLKRKFTQSGQRSQSSGSRGGGGNQNTLGSAPPTATIQDMICVREARLFKGRVSAEVMEKEDYKPLKAEVTDAMGPWRDLQNTAKKRMAALDTRSNAWKNMKDSKSGDGSPTVFLCLIICYAFLFSSLSIARACLFVCLLTLL